jgi:hypothetical protein
VLFLQKNMKKLWEAVLATANYYLSLHEYCILCLYEVVAEERGKPCVRCLYPSSRAGAFEGGTQ